MAAIEVEGLVKRYGPVEAVSGIDFHVGEGEVVALLGPNGAGKTTTVEILEGHRRRTAGRVRVLGVDPERGGRAFRERIGIVLQEAGIETRLTVRETVETFAILYPRRRAIEEVLAVVGLVEQADARIGTLSGGQRRRLDLALALLGDPDLLFLDEPTTGFDPSARRRAWELLEGLRSLGKTILLTTHYMEEAQRLADRVVLVVEGRLVAQGAPDEVSAGGALASTVSFLLPWGRRAEELPLPPGYRRRGRRIEVDTERPTHLLHALTGWAVEQGVELEGLRVAGPGLEDAYLALTEEGRDA